MSKTIVRIKYVGGSYWNGYQTMVVSFLFNEDLNRKEIKLDYLYPYGMVDETENAIIYDNEVCSKILNNFIYLLTNFKGIHRYYDHYSTDGEEFSLDITYDSGMTSNYYFYGSKDSLYKEIYFAFNEIRDYINTLIALYFKDASKKESQTNLKN
jgi:hypothetical protein